MRRSHDMPFGAQVQNDGSVCFRLWAPGARRVELALDGTSLPMQTEQGGWYSVETREAGVGSAYCFRIDGDLLVPDPASRAQQGDVHGPSAVVDPRAFEWQDGDWRGRPWEEAVICEVHTGSYTPEGTFAALEARLDHLLDLGVTVLELMPVADFPGARNWGYDGVLAFAPARAYGTPHDLKRLVQAAHAKGLMVFLDVVYNHFGPEGNYLHTYAPQFFTERHHTPWGAAINFDGPDAGPVRQFFIHNALYWLEEYHLDGLRLDAVHAIIDDTSPDILVELAETVRTGPGRERHVHLVLENDANIARYLQRDTAGQARWYDAQWNDDIHHALHVLTTGEAAGYYADYADAPGRHLGRCLAEGFAYQGEPSSYRNGAPRGEPSTGLPPTAFVGFLQNHDQVGNRALGERIGALAPPDAVRAATYVLLLAPAPPLLFMGQEWGSRRPFPFFCDFGPELAAKVTQGRRREFERFPEFRDPAARDRIPDPNDPATFALARLDWAEAEAEGHRDWLALHRELLALRQRRLVPRLAGVQGKRAGFQVIDRRALRCQWTLADGAALTLMANMHNEPAYGASRPGGALLAATDPGVEAALDERVLPPWAVAWFVQEPGTGNG